MSCFIRYTIGLFDGDESLYAFLDDNLISLRNSSCCRSAFLFFEDKNEKIKAKTFLLANDYDVLNKSKNNLNILFSTVDVVNNLHLFFLNTNYLKEKLSDLIEKKLDGYKKSSTIHAYLLNSDSNKNYYTHRMQYLNINLIGSPSSPMDMSNNEVRPF